MNTQRPEWNDANNALVGKGLSVVTVAYLYRFVTYWLARLAAHGADTFAANTAIADLTEAYDNDTRNIIRGIQEKYDLHVDGVVGPFTKIALYNESRMFKKPSLGRKRQAGTENGS